jgi:hypothetical protein
MEKSMTTRTRQPQHPTPDARRPAPDIWQIRDRLNENFQRVQQLLARLPADSDSRAQLDLLAEVRQNIALANRASETTVALESAQVFEQAVLDTLERASPNLRKEFIRRLNEREQTWRSKYDRRPRPG